GAGEVADLHYDALVGHIFARDRHGLARIALAILEHVGERSSVDAARAVDLVERDVEALFPLRAVLRILPSQRTGDSDQDRFVGLRENSGGNERAGEQSENSAAMKHHEAPVAAAIGPADCDAGLLIVHKACSRAAAHVNRALA